MFSREAREFALEFSNGVCIVATAAKQLSFSRCNGTADCTPVANLPRLEMDSSRPRSWYFGSRLLGHANDGEELAIRKGDVEIFECDIAPGAE
jgi:hypothetical protein